ncbi:MAG TPA: serine/threonine-protein kinase, partial [Myxococcota bacterium]
ILTGERAREEAFTRALRNEIHNVARLSHPGIILLFEAGEVDDDAEKNSRGRFAAGSPFFAMELASNGALSPKRLPLPWGTSRMLLLSLLDALAHGHARGVIHRDLKPGNILLCAPGDPRPGLKLTDFGIAQPLGEHVDGEAEQGRLSGTPRYMAPEQFQAKWRDFGPWTDLYALGCIGYQLATGKAPFSGDALKLAIQHCHDTPAPPTKNMSKEALRAYPDGYDAWVLRLLEKDPVRRFTCAADAAWALLALKSADVEEEITAVAGSGWEDALKSLKPLVPDPSDMSGAPTLLRPSSSKQEDMSQSAISKAIARTEHTNVNTIVDRPFARATRDTSELPLGKRPAQKFASLTSEAELTKPLPLQDDSLFPKIAPEASSAKARPRDKNDKSASGKRKAKAPAGVAVSTLSGPALKPADKKPEAKNARAVLEAAVVDAATANIPWTELAAMSPGEAMPTVTGRAAIDAETALRRGKQRSTIMADAEAVLAPRAPPPMPPTWRRPGADAPSKHLLGAGLGLYGLRQIPLVDRNAERDLVW